MFWVVGFGAKVGLSRGSDISSLLLSARCLGIFLALGRSTGSAISIKPLGAVFVFVTPNARPVSPSLVHSEVSRRMKGLCGSSGISLSTVSIGGPLVVLILYSALTTVALEAFSSCKQ